jgi:hypothetical protein
MKNEFDFVSSYALIIYAMLFTSIYSPLLPWGTLVTFFLMFNLYFLEKVNFLLVNFNLIFFSVYLSNHMNRKLVYKL